MRKFNRVLAASLSLAMGLSLVACGSSTKTTENAANEGNTAEASKAEPTATTAEGGEGKVLNIQCWNEEFANRLADHYPGFVKNNPDDVTQGGKIGDVTVNFSITPSQDNAYQSNLDDLLPVNLEKSADERVDLFLVEADYAKKYTNAATPVAMSMDELGITSADIADQFKYTQDIVSDASGAIRGLSWQACPCLFIYRADYAEQVLGSSDPAEVQKAVADWDTYKKTADKFNAAGIHMQETVNDSYRVYADNATTPWVTDDKISIDANLMKWVDDSKAMVDAGETTTQALWSDAWNAGMMTSGKTFGFFGPLWLISFCMHADDSTSVAANGGWKACAGPQQFSWGGSWICAAEGTDNAELVKDIMLKLTTDEQILTDIATKDQDCVNSHKVLNTLGADESKGVPALGNQNVYADLAASADNIDRSKVGDYDQGCIEEFQNAMTQYFDGNKTKDEALEEFYKKVQDKYPNLSH